jgi:KUP system potassium uptake protein
MFTFAVLATFIASQAMITATFSLIQQVINSKAFPPLRMLYTSETIQGQVYVPAANWTLMIITIALVAILTNLTNLTNAYGFAVATVMFTTSVMIAVQIKFVKHWPVIVGILYFIIFGFFDALFWGASFKKVPLGAWIPLMIGSILCITMIFWVWAKRLEDNFDGKTRMNLRHFIGKARRPSASPTEDGDIYYYMRDRVSHFNQNGHRDDESAEGDKGKELPRIDSCAVFHKVTSGKGVPHTFVGFIKQWPSLPHLSIYLSCSQTSRSCG